MRLRVDPRSGKFGHVWGTDWHLIPPAIASCGWLVSWRFSLLPLALWLTCLSGCALTELYPKVPVVDKFACFDEFTKFDDQHPKSTENPSAADACKSCEDAADVLTYSPDECDSFDLTRYVSAAGVFAAPQAPDKCACRIKSALICAKSTRQMDGDFLMCREERQLGIGTGIATLAAGAGGAVVAGSTLAAVIMGSIAGGS